MSLDTGTSVGNLVLLCRFRCLVAGFCACPTTGWPLRHVQRRKTEAPECVIEQPVDFPDAVAGSLTGPLRRWQVIALHRQEEAVCCSCCLVLNQFRGANFLKSMSMSYLQKIGKRVTSSPLPAGDGWRPATRAARMTSLLFLTLAHHLLSFCSARV